MQLDPHYLRQHYAMLSDEALLEIDRADLVEMARAIFDQEVASRKPVPSQDARHRGGPLDARAEREETDGGGEPHDSGDQPGWLEEAAEVYSHAVPSASADSPDAVLDARDAIEAAGIPCHMDLCEIPPEKSLSPYGTHRWRLLVPGKLNLEATSVLELEVFNVEFEAGWKAHLESLSDRELREMNPEVALCGLFDRIKRVNRVYDEEIARRKLR